MPAPVYIPRRDLRELFRQQGFPERIRTGEVSERVIASSPPAAVRSFPPGTLSQRVAYLDGSGKQIAIIHRFRLPDGRLGASGLPDPKELLVEGILYKADPADRD